MTTGKHSLSIFLVRRISLIDASRSLDAKEHERASTREALM